MTVADILIKNSYRMSAILTIEKNFISKLKQYQMIIADIFIKNSYRMSAILTMN